MMKLIDRVCLKCKIIHLIFIHTFIPVCIFSYIYIYIYIYSDYTPRTPQVFWFSSEKATTDIVRVK